MRKWIWACQKTLFINISFMLLSIGALSAQEFRFSVISVDGNFRTQESSIIAFSELETGVAYDGGDLSQAYARVADTGLFSDVTLTPQGSKLLIEVIELPTVNAVAIEGNRRLNDDMLLNLIQTKTRRVFEQQTVFADADEIATAYAQSGRIAAKVTPKVIERSNNRVDVVFEVYEGALSEIEKIAFVGNVAYPDRRLKRVLETKQAGLLRQFIQRDTFVADRISYDEQLLSDFYTSRGYVDFEVRHVDRVLSEERDAFFLTFHIVEGAQFKFGTVDVASDLSEINLDDFQPLINVKRGVLFNPKIIDRQIDRMRTQVSRLGKEFVQVRPRLSRNNKTLTIDVTLHIERAPKIFVERINISGNNGTLDRVIRRQFKLVEGDPIDEAELRAGAERVRNLGFFKNVEAYTTEGSSPDQRVINIEVEEGPTGSFGIGGAFDTFNGFGVFIDYAERNFLGRGQNFKLGFSNVSNDRSYSLEFGEPAFLGRDLFLGLDLGYSQTKNSSANFDLKRFNGEFQLGFDLSDTTYFTGSVGLDRTEISNATNSGALVRAEADRGSLSIPTLGYEINYNSRKSGLDPTRGLTLRFKQDFGLHSDAQFIRTEAGAYYDQLVFGEIIKIQAALEVGTMTYLSDSKSRITERFKLNQRRLRGFANSGVGPRERSATVDQALGGLHYASARAEARFPVGLPEEYGINGGLFYNAGSLWGLDSTNADVLYEDFSLRQTIGVAVFWDTPIGPLRFDFMRPLQKETFDKDESFAFSISTGF